MPRKIKPFPQVLFTQSLSTGRFIRDHYIVSDIPDENGEYPVIMVPQDMSPPKRMLSGDEMITRQKNKELEIHKRLLASAGLGALVGIAKPEPKPTKPSLPYQPGHRAIKLGNDLVMQAPLPPYRRW